MNINGYSTNDLNENSTRYLAALEKLTHASYAAALTKAAQNAGRRDEKFISADDRVEVYGVFSLKPHDKNKFYVVNESGEIESVTADDNGTHNYLVKMQFEVYSHTETNVYEKRATVTRANIVSCYAYIHDGELNLVRYDSTNETWVNATDKLSASMRNAGFSHNELLDITAVQLERFINRAEKSTPNLKERSVKNPKTGEKSLYGEYKDIQTAKKEVKKNA